LNDAEELYVRAAEETAHIAGEAICIHGEFTLCLSGGSTPAATYDLLATRFRLSVDWKEVQFFWGDDRCGPIRCIGCAVRTRRRRPPRPTKMSCENASALATVNSRASTS